MSLNFVGTGSAFNTDLGCNAAYYKREDSMFLIDCGSDVFSKLKNDGTLEGIKNIYIVITHLHADHVGSLPTMIEYFYWKLSTQAHIYAPYELQLPKLLSMMHISDDMYTQSVELENFILDKSFPGGIYVKAIETIHKAGIKCYGYLIAMGNRVVYYSGDSCELQPKMLDLFYQDKIDFWYQDIAFVDYGGDVHLFYGKLLDTIPQDRRQQFVLMHLEEQYGEERSKQILHDGFLPAARLQ